VDGAPLIAEVRPAGFLSALARTALLVGVSDGLFASATGLFIPPYATPLRVFRGVASVPLGSQALNGGLTTGLIGIATHFSVAFFWSAVFIVGLRNSAKLREAVRSWPSALVVAAMYGMSIWMIMSLIVIPTMVHHSPTIGLKWWVQLIGHIPFVAMPMILVYRKYDHSREGA
jgi:uncharacterized membrane protein YagU involved in acid resistance